MIRHIITRLALMIPVIFFVTIMVFTLMHLIPGDPAYVMLGEEASPEAVEALRKELGLDRSLPVQYFAWMRKAVKGDLGRSIKNNVKILDTILARLPITAYLAVSAVVFSILIGLPAGIIAGVRPKTAMDVVATVLAMAGIAMPSFWLGILLIFFFAFKLEWLPILGYVSPAEDLWDSLRHMVLPAITLGASMAATNTRFIRSSMLDVMNKEYITTARSKGLKEIGIIRGHALKNALIPVVTMLGLQIAMLFGGALVVETIFAIPGLGRLIVDAIFARDFPMVQGIVLFMAVFVLTANFIVDILYSFLDPRIRLGR
ncbi:MAG: nickel ABC transporter permease [Candidatus Adiutricales bacterium]